MKKTFTLTVFCLSLLFSMTACQGNLQNKGSEVKDSIDISQIAEKVASQTFTANGVSFQMQSVEGGTFTMGATAEQGRDAFDAEKPKHEVTLSAFQLAETEVTQELWQAVMGSNPSEFKGDAQRPVEKVSWADCQAFISKLNALTGQKFRLPTEAEWEFAARGGIFSKGFKYAGSNNLEDVAWYDKNSGRTTHPVKTKAPNELGLYDMSGNVDEWTADWKGNYGNKSQTDPKGSANGTKRICRGGNWYNIDRSCRVSYRDVAVPGNRSNGLGLRLAL